MATIFNRPPTNNQFNFARPCVFVFQIQIRSATMDAGHSLSNRVRPVNRKAFVEIDPPNKSKSLVDDTFQYAIWPVLAMAQCFGMMPIVGVYCGAIEDEKACDRLMFRWRSVRVLWTLFYLGVGLLLAYLYISRISETGVTAKNMGLNERL